MPLDPAIKKLVTSNYFTQQQAENLNYAAIHALRNSRVRQLITAGTLTAEYIAAITTDAASEALRDAGVRKLITAGTLTAEHIAGIRTNAVSEALRDAGMRKLISTKKLTMEQVLTLTDAASNALRDAGVRELISTKKLTMAEVLKLTDAASKALRDAGVRQLITAGTLTMVQVLALTDAASKALRDAGVRKLISTKKLTMEQVLTLTDVASKALRDAGVRELITAGTLTAEHIAAITTDAANYALRDAGVRELITVGTLTMAQVLALTYAASNALRDADTQQMLRDGQITIEEILDPVHHHAHGVAAVVPNINDAQSTTHTASVHQAVSESATRLADRYQLKIDGAGLESVISMIQSYVNSLSDDSEKHKAAKRCVLRITSADYTFTDHGSHITTRQLLALTFLAISDASNRAGSLEDARAQFVEGLYEIQRGYNLSGTGVDKGGPDRFICSPGTFNKLIEKSQGIHPDCQIRFITKETASLKLPTVVREEAMQYLASLANPSTVEGLRSFTRLITQVKENGVEVLWDQIKGNVADRMFDEFGSLYRDRADQSFTDLIDAGLHAELPDLSIFQKQIQSSRGYHQFCSQMLHQSGMLFTPKASAECFSEHQHNGPKAQ